jgi:hypothetical protein
VVAQDAHYGNINQLLLEALTKTKRPYARIVLSDIAMDVPGTHQPGHRDYALTEHQLPEALAEYVNAGGELVVLDHHPRALQVKAYYQRWLHPDSILQKVDNTGVARAGSEQAATYYRLKREFRDPPELVRAVIEFGRVCGAYDVWRKGPDFDLGAQLAMGLGLMGDNPTAFNDMLAAVYAAAGQARKSTGPIDWLAALGTSSLARYVDWAPTVFEAEVARAQKTALRHGPYLLEIHSEFFESLVAEKLYEKTRGIVCMRYDPTRHEAKKLSFRSHADFGLDLGKVLGPLGGGGHALAAGINFSEGYIDSVIDCMLNAIDCHTHDEAA